MDRQLALELVGYAASALVAVSLTMSSILRLRVLLDFVTPAYRDFMTGRYVFREQAEFFRARGIEEIVSAPGSRRHAAYLRRIGFVCVDPNDEMAAYRLRIAA